MNTMPADPNHAFSGEERRGVYRAIYERRDMRHFSGGAVADEVLQRLLRAALADMMFEDCWASLPETPFDSGEIHETCVKLTYNLTS